MNDESFREIQLNGKQLVFLFMAASVVLVLSFLFGVLVGRNTRVGGDGANVAASEIAPDAGASAVAENVAPPPAGGAPAADTPAAKQAEELSYADRLLREAPAEENLKPATASPPRHAVAPPREAAAPPREKPAPPREKPAAEQAPAVQEAVAATPPAPRPAPAPPVPTSAEGTAPVASAATSNPSGPGFAVQVAAYRDRRESDTLAKQLMAKGYPAFVLDPVKGAPTALFRVRVGKYKTLKDAQAIMAQLQSAEQFNTAWIAR